MITTELKDAIGQPIKEGWAAYVEPGRGSVHTAKVYIIGTKGTKGVSYLGSTWGMTAQDKDLIEAYINGDPIPPEDLKHRTRKGVSTRTIMLNKGE